MAINNLPLSEFLDLHNSAAMEGQVMISPTTIFPTHPSPTASATIAPPLTRTNIRPEVTVTMNSPATHLDETALRVAERATMERIRNELYRSNQDRWFQPQEFSSDFFTGVQNSFRYLSEQNDEHTDIRNIRPIGARISQESPNTQRVKVAVQSPKVSNHSDLVKFFKEKVELKLNGIKTDTTIELTLSLNLVDTGEEILSTQEVIELD